LYLLIVSKLFREEILTPDGGQVSLDWFEPITQQSEQSASSSNCHTDESKPIALFLPGLTGDSQTEYIKSLVPTAHQLGYRSVVFNNRGRGNMKLLTPRLYCAANYDDLKLVLELLRYKNPKVKIVVTGISLGGIVLGRYLIYAGNDAVIDAAMLISVCWDFLSGCESMEKPGLNFALNQHLTKSLKTIVNEHKEVFQTVNKIDFEEIMQSKCLREFDERFTIRMWGFKSVKDYYSESSHKGKLCCIKRPTLCVNAADDMFAPALSNSILLLNKLFSHF
jgi:abhydrolase domain-containing protein 1/3